MPVSPVSGIFQKHILGVAMVSVQKLSVVTQVCSIVFALSLLRFSGMAIRKCPAWLALREILAIHWNSVAKTEGIALQPWRNFFLHVDADIPLAWKHDLVVQAAAKAYAGFICGFHFVFYPRDGALQVG